MISDKIRKMRADVKEREAKWQKEREELKKEIGELRGRLESIEKERDGRKEGQGEVKEEGKWEIGKRDKAMEAKVRELERWRELEERDRRRNNVVVKGVAMEEGRLKKAVEKLWLEMGVERGIEKVKEIGRKTGK